MPIIPPTRAGYSGPTNYGTATTPKTSPTPIDLEAGDLVTIIATMENRASGTMTDGLPVASAGTVSWNAHPVQQEAQGSVSGAWGYYGTVTTGALGVTFQLDRPTSETFNWDFTVTVWRNHGGIGAFFSGNNGIGSSAPLITQNVSANSAVQIGINDWNAIDGSGRIWRTVNGAPQTESLYGFFTDVQTVYGGYTPDVGVGGSVSQGLTTPLQRWVGVGFEILGYNQPSPPVDGYLLMENSDRILFENNDLAVSEDFSGGAPAPAPSFFGWGLPI